MRTGFALLAPGAFLFAARAGLAAAGVEPADVWGLTVLTRGVGAVSLAGLVLLCVTAWPTAERWRTLLPALVILAGHFLVRPYVADVGGSLGAAMVFWGTGALASLRIRVAAWAGLVAAFGALMRMAPPPNDTIGHLFVVLGSAGTGIFLVEAARGAQRE